MSCLVSAHHSHANMRSNLRFSNVPKTNKRFLTSIIKSTDDHNKTILRAQAMAAEEVRQERRENEKNDRRRRAEEAVEAERMRRFMGKRGGDWAHNWDGRKGRSKDNGDEERCGRREGKRRERSWERRDEDEKSEHDDDYDRERERDRDRRRSGKSEGDRERRHRHRHRSRSTERKSRRHDHDRKSRRRSRSRSPRRRDRSKHDEDTDSRTKRRSSQDPSRSVSPHPSDRRKRRRDTDRRRSHSRSRSPVEDGPNCERQEGRRQSGDREWSHKRHRTSMSQSPLPERSSNKASRRSSQSPIRSNSGKPEKHDPRLREDELREQLKSKSRISAEPNHSNSSGRSPSPHHTSNTPEAPLPFTACPSSLQNLGTQPTSRSPPPPQAPPRLKSSPPPLPPPPAPPVPVSPPEEPTTSKSKSRSKTDSSSKRTRKTREHPRPPSSSPPPLPSHLPSKMDKYFESTYDPRLDVAPLSLPEVPATGLIPDADYAGWDAMLDLIRIRREDKEEKKRLERWGVSKDKDKGKKSDSSGGDKYGSGELDVMTIEYNKRGSVREWDLGKEGF